MRVSAYPAIAEAPRVSARDKMAGQVEGTEKTLRIISHRPTHMKSEVK